MSSFSKILEEKLKKEQDVAPQDSTYEVNLHISNGLSELLLAWLSKSQGAKRSYYKVNESIYSIYKKDPKTLEAQKIQREKADFELFLTQIPCENSRNAARFFYHHGARAFISRREIDLKRDYKRLALRLHPDRHFHESPSVQRQFLEDFRVLSQCYETLRELMSRAK